MYSVLEDEIVYDQDRVATLPILFKQNTTNFTEEEVFWAGMNAVEAVGGMYVKPGVMLLNDITPLLKFESSVFWHVGEKFPYIVMGHMAARVLKELREVPDHKRADEVLRLLGDSSLVKR